MASTLSKRYTANCFFPSDNLSTDLLQAWMEKGLNPKGYLVCKFAFKVSHAFMISLVFPCSSLRSGFLASLPCFRSPPGTTRVKQKMNTITRIPSPRMLNLNLSRCLNAWLQSSEHLANGFHVYLHTIFINLMLTDNKLQWYSKARAPLLHPNLWG